MADRADLARLRQLMRAKEDKPKTKTKSRKSIASSDGTNAAASQRESLKSEEPKAAKRLSTAPSRVASALTNTNVALLVRQILQRKHYGDVAEYLSKTRKDELFQLLTQIAQYAYELRERHQTETGAMQSEQDRLQHRTHELAGRVLELESQLATSQTDREQLEQRLQVSQTEYTDVVDNLRKYQEQWDASQTTMAQQQQLLQEMSRSLDERTRQVDALSVDAEAARQSLVDTQQESVQLRTQLQVLEMESERMHQQQKDERRENKTLLWELQTKTRDCDDLTSQVDEARDRILTLEGQIQVELFTAKSLAQERDAAQLVYRREREDWKNAEAARKEAEQLKSQEFRSLDLEVRQLKQTVSRLRSDLEMELKQREKAEDTARRATDIADELRAAGKSLHFDVQRLATELQEERSSRESKEGALALAYRELQSLQKRLRDEETARADAQAEVEALSHRMKLIRRDHLAKLHRVEAPPQLATRWKESATRYAESPEAPDL